MLRRHLPLALGLAALGACSERAAPEAFAVPAVPTAGLEAPLARLLDVRIAAVRARPADPEAAGTLALVYDAHDFPDEALACYARAAELAPKDFRWPYLAGTLAYEQDQARGVEWLDRAALLRDDYAPLFVRRGLGRLFLGELDLAHADFARALELEPSLAAAWLGRARVALARDDAAAALEALEQASRLAPKSDEIHGLRAEALRRSGDRAAAEQAAALVRDGGRREPLPDPIRETVTTAGVTRAWTDRRVAEAMERGDVEAAVAARESGVELDPGDPYARLRLADLLLRTSRAEEAREHLAAAKESLATRGAGDPGARDEEWTRLSAELAESEGLVELAEGRQDAAAERFEAALALDPSRVGARGNLGLMRVRAGRLAEGIELLRAAVAELPAGSPARASLLSALVDAGAHAPAHELVVSLLADEPDDPFLVFLRGRTNAGLGRLEAAAADFARAATLEPGNEAAPLNEARAHLASGDEARAARVLAEAAERIPGSRTIAQRRAWLLATARDHSVADGGLAVELARPILASAPESPEYLTLMAAAFAARGDFEFAEQHELLAIDTLTELPAGEAPPARERYLVEMRERLAAYRAGERWREPPPSAPRTAVDPPR